MSPQGRLPTGVIVKRNLIQLIAILACSYGLAGASHRPKPVAMDLLAVFSADHAQKLHRNFAYLPVHHLAVREKILQFTMKGIPFKIQWVGQKSRFIRFNGHSFSRHNLSNFQEFKKAFYGKFGIHHSPPRKYGMMNLLVRQAEAISFMSPLGETTGTEKKRTERQGPMAYVFESMKKGGFKKYFANSKLFKTDNILTDKETEERMKEAFPSMTKGYEMAMIQFIYTYLDGMAFGMTPHGGYQPGVGINLLNDAQGFVRPSSIPFPY